MKGSFQFILLCFGLVLPSVLLSQNEPVHLKSQLAMTGTEDSARIELLLSVSEFYGTDSPDSSLKYALEAMSLAGVTGDRVAEARALQQSGLANYMLGKFSLCVFQWNKSLEIYEKLGMKAEMARMLNNNAVVMFNVGIDTMAIEYWTRRLELAEDLRDTLNMIVTNHNLGYLYRERGKSYDLASEYFKRALELSELKSFREGTGYSSHDLGLTYMASGNLEEALKYLIKSKEAYEELKSDDLVGTLLSLGQYHYTHGDIDEAIGYQEEALRLLETQQDYLMRLRANLDLADSYFTKGAFQRAIKQYTFVTRIGKGEYTLEEQYRANVGLAESYLKLSQPGKAIPCFQNALVLKDSMVNMERDTNAEQENFRSEIAQKELRDNLTALGENLEMQSQLSKMAERRSRILKIAGLMMLGAMSIVLFFLVMMIRFNRQRKKANMELQQQFDVISHQQKEIRESLEYARRIQSAVLPSEEVLGELLPDHFVLFKPRDIVSGDFYWIRQIGHYTIVVVADCTGHGVPGAFMSMLGISMLNDIVTKSRFDSAGELLDRLRKKVKSTLSQEGREMEQKDGMDMALAIIDNETREMQFAGAFNPIYVIRMKGMEQDPGMEELLSSESEGHRLYEIKGDRQPIAIYSEEKSFRTTRIMLLQDDSLYMFSDGYPDQIGGKKEKKFMVRKFKELLLSIQDQSMVQQQFIVDRTLEEWKKDVDQVDDILVFGIRMK